MPELPEVETVVRQLRPRLIGRTLRRLELLDPKLEVERPGRSRGRTVQRVWREGKWIALELRRAGASPLILGVHLRMTGRLLWTPAPPPRATRHLRARLLLDEGGVAFIDPRRFGVLRLAALPEELRTGGLEPLARACTLPALAALLAGSEQEIKAWLMRQDRLVGLGNIYAAEALHAAGIHPTRIARGLDEGEVEVLWRAIRDILRRAIRCCGTTFSDFQDTRGRAGAFRERLAVYGREGEPCRTCGHPVQRTVQQGRSTCFCPGCQPAR